MIPANTSGTDFEMQSFRLASFKSHLAELRCLPAAIATPKTTFSERVKLIVNAKRIFFGHVSVLAVRNT